MTARPERALAVAGAFAGLLGVAASAAAAHLTGEGSLDVAARVLLVHAPAFLGLAALLDRGAIGRRLGLAAGIGLGLGLVLFCGDLSVRALYGVAPLRLAAPTGGVLLMLGWALVGVAALAPRRG